MAIDGSEQAGIAVDLVAGLEWPAGSTLQVVEVVSSGVSVFGGPWPPIAPVDTSSIDTEIRRQAARNLKGAAERLVGSGRTVETVATAGRAGDAIVSLAEQAEADIIVVGSRGHGTLATMLLGSTSSEIVDHAHVPVLVARGRSVERILFAWDGSDHAGAAVPALISWGLFHTAHIDVLSVADAEPPWWVRTGLGSDETAAEVYRTAGAPSRRQHEEMAQEMAERLQAAGLEAAPVSREGDPAESIVSFAEAHEIDLVLLGTHGQSGLRRLLMGGVARNVLLHAPCSVLVAR